ncbi:MAG TPA: HDOD domain-containing protein [Rhodothermales bacterium]|nr:HDOD domain-containing protein [Rhodothermales bacterium]
MPDQYQQIPISSQRAVELQNANELMKGIMIPPRPSILVEVLNEQSKTEPDLPKIANLISKDVAISAGVLRVVNSSYFALPRKITSIDHAVRLMGVRSVTNIVTALMLHTAFSDHKGTFMDDFWSSSGNLAAATSLASSRTRHVEKEEGYALGLFANCGVPLMLKKFTSYPAIYERARTATDVAPTAHEDEELGTAHTLVGYIMGRSWELPENVCQSILRHHDTVDYFDGEEDLGEATPYLAVLQLGHFLNRSLENLPESYEWSLIGESVCRYLGMSERDLENLKDESAAIFHEK